MSEQDLYYANRENQRLFEINEQQQARAEKAEAERDRLREALEAAFREGWQDGHSAREASAACEPTWGEDAAWADSETRAALEGE